MDPNDVRCEFCNCKVNPSSRYVWHRVVGWERKGKAGGSDIALRERRDGFACDPCVSMMRNQLHFAQLSLDP